MAIATTIGGPGSLTLGAAGTLKTLTAQVRSCTLEPSVDTEEPITTLSGESVAGARTESFVLTGTLLQDLGSTDGIAEWLYANAGTVVPFSFTPNTASGKEINGSVVVEAIALGGEVGAVLESDFEFKVVGSRPTIGAIA